MLKNLFLFALVFLVGYAGWEHFKPAPPPPLTAEQEVAALVSQSVIPAKDLAAMSMKHPTLVTAALKGKTVAVSGVVLQAFVVGVNSDDLKLELAGIPNLKFSFRTDFGRKQHWGAAARYRFQKVGKEIVGLSVVKASSEEKTNSDRVYPQIDSSSEAAALQSMVGKIAEAYGAVKNSGGSKPSRPKQAGEQTIRRALFREGESAILRGQFRHIGAGWIRFDLLDLP